MLARLFALFRRDRLDHELMEEMEAHLEREAARQVARGLPPEEARRIARRDFGNLALHAETAREAWGWTWLEQLGQDLRYGIRTLRRSPGFTFVAALSLALGIGSNTAIYGLLYNVLFQPLAVNHPERLAVVRRVGRGGSDQWFPSRDVAALRQAAAGAPLTALRGADNVPLDGTEGDGFVNLDFVDQWFDATVQAPVARGRFISAEDVTQRAPVAVISSLLAERRFGGADAALGRRVRLRGLEVTVIGVMSRAFNGLQYPGYFEMAVPLSLETAVGLPDSRADSTQLFTVVLRAGDPARWPALAGRLDAAFRACCGLRPEAHMVLDEMRAGIGGGKDDIRSGVAPMLYALLGCVVVVLLIACANVGNLLLLRAAAREREITVRLSLGSSRRRIVRQLLTECALLGAAAVGLGLCFAAWTRGLLARSLPAIGWPIPKWPGSIPRRGWSSPRCCSGSARCWPPACCRHSAPRGRISPRRSGRVVGPGAAGWWAGSAGAWSSPRWH